MNSGSKLIAIALVLASFAVPASAIASCWSAVHLSAAAGTGMNCPPGCPMMAQQANPQHEISPEKSTCCKISSGNPAPASIPPATVITPTLTIAPFKTDVVAVKPTALHLSVIDAEASAPDASPQAVLCTFLI